MGTARLVSVCIVLFFLVAVDEIGERDEYRSCELAIVLANGLFRWGVVEVEDPRGQQRCQATETQHDSQVHLCKNGVYTRAK